MFNKTEKRIEDVRENLPLNVNSLVLFNIFRLADELGEANLVALGTILTKLSILVFKSQNAIGTNYTVHSNKPMMCQLNGQLVLNAFILTKMLFSKMIAFLSCKYVFNYLNYNLSRFS